MYPPCHLYLLYIYVPLYVYSSMSMSFQVYVPTCIYPSVCMSFHVYMPAVEIQDYLFYYFLIL